jgi:hypothetical protein
MPGMAMRLVRTITAKNRAEIARMVELVPEGAQVEIMSDPQTDPQRRLMFALLGDLSEQLLHCGERLSKEDWKAVFLKAGGAKLRWVPALDGEGVVAIGYSSKILGKVKMSEMIERIYEYGARHGVKFREPGERAA